MVSRKVFVVFSVLLSVLFISVSAVDAGLAIRLEKEVPQSAVKGVNPITASVFDSKTTASPVATQNFAVRDLTLSMLETLGGEPMYRVRMDFTETDTLTSAMELYWEFSLGGMVIGKRERVLQSAWAIFAAEAATASTAGHATTAGDANTLDGIDSTSFADAAHSHAISSLAGGGQSWLDGASATGTFHFPESAWTAPFSGTCAVNITVRTFENIPGSVFQARAATSTNGSPANDGSDIHYGFQTVSPFYYTGIATHAFSIVQGNTYQFGCWVDADGTFTGNDFWCRVSYSCSK